MSPTVRSARVGGCLVVIAALTASATCEAQGGVSVSHPDANRPTTTAKICADDREAAEARIQACTSIINAGGLGHRDLANMYIYRARAARAAHETDAAARDLDLAVKADDRYSIAYFERERSTTVALRT